MTTDHISPAGAIKTDVAGRPLPPVDHGVAPADFNSYGSRRGNDRVMTRGTFANVRIKNLMVPGVEGGVTVHQPGRRPAGDLRRGHAATRPSGFPLVVFAGQEYGTGSSRDWAAKGTRLLGVRAVVAQSFERIHRSNLVGMGVLPLQFPDGVSAAVARLDGAETFDLAGLGRTLRPRQEITLTVTRSDGSQTQTALRRPHRHADRGRLLPPRRHPAVRAAAAPGGLDPQGFVRPGRLPSISSIVLTTTHSTDRSAFIASSVGSAAFAAGPMSPRA